MNQKCQGKTEVYSRVCGFFRPVQSWNIGKRAEYNERLNFKPMGERNGRSDSAVRNTETA